jgi:hypothetical protein
MRCGVRSATKIKTAGKGLIRYADSCRWRFRSMYESVVMLDSVEGKQDFEMIWEVLLLESWFDFFLR